MNLCKASAPSIIAMGRVFPSWQACEYWKTDASFALRSRSRSPTTQQHHSEWLTLLNKGVRHSARMSNAFPSGLDSYARRLLATMVVGSCSREHNVHLTGPPEIYAKQGGTYVQSM
jgi:hypothetical protein